MLKILTIHEAYPGPLRPARVQQPASLADPQGALLGHVRRGLGRLHRADDARPGVRRGRPGAAAPAVEVLPPCRGQRDPRPRDARRRDDRRRGHGTARRPCLPDRGGGRRQDHPGEAVVLPALDLLRRPDRLLPPPPASPARRTATASTSAATTRRCSPTGRCRSSICPNCSATNSRVRAEQSEPSQGSKTAPPRICIPGRGCSSSFAASASVAVAGSSRLGWRAARAPIEGLERQCRVVTDCMAVIADRRRNAGGPDP